MRSMELLLQKLTLFSSDRGDIQPEDWYVVETDVNEILGRIAGCDTLAEAGPFLDKLGDLQEVLARLAFKYHVLLPPRLRQLVREFDRSDDPDLRAFVYARIKSAQFLTDHNHDKDSSESITH